jgi:hypothetical protein
VPAAVVDAGTGVGAGAVHAEPVAFDKVDDTAVFQYFMRHLSAMLRKRFLYFIRDSRSWVYQYFLPVMFVLIGMIVLNVAVPNRSQPKVRMIQGGVQQMYNTKVGYALPTPYAAAPVVCLNAHPQPYPNNDDSHETSLPCRNVTYFTTHANTTKRGLKSYNGKVALTPTNVLSNLKNAASGYPLVPVKGAANVSYMSTYLLAHGVKYEASVIGALTITNLGVNGTSTRPSPYPASPIINLETIIHGNYTCQFAGPMYAALVADAVVKSYSAASSISMSMEPLPYTKVRVWVFA